MYHYQRTPRSLRSWDYGYWNLDKQRNKKVWQFYFFTLLNMNKQKENENFLVNSKYSFYLFKRELFKIFPS